MTVEIMFVAMTAIICTFMVVRMGIAHAGRKLQVRSGESDGRLEAIVKANEAEVARLRERVQVLEKLVTDDDRKLAGEIERLRTGPRAGPGA